MSSTSKPVANGSSVPPWPIRRVPSARRATLTTSWDVMPPGLSTSNNPSIGRRSTRGAFIGVGRGLHRPLIMKLSEQRFDSCSVGHALIELERDFGSDAQSQRAADPRPQVARDAAQPIERGRALGLTSEDADVDLCVPKIPGNVDTGHGHEANDARVLHTFGQERRHFFANRLSDAIGATGIVRHDSMNPAPGGVARALFTRAEPGAHAA